MLLNMHTAEIKQLEQKELICRQLLAECIEAIEQLNGYEPDGFEIAFLIKGVKTFSMPVPPTEHEFCLCFFISWRLYYHRQLEDITAQLWALRSRIAV
jgi:hypothetical protein